MSVGHSGFFGSDRHLLLAIDSRDLEDVENKNMRGLKVRPIFNFPWVSMAVREGAWRGVELST
jgi:hypothetical protein